jgi:hypothetical protein
MNEINNFSWTVIVSAGILGIIIIFVATKISKSSRADEQILGASLRQRAMFLMLNGITLFFVSLIGLIIKFSVYLKR